MLCISDSQRSGCQTRDDKDKGAARGGEEDLPLHPHQAPRPRRHGARRPHVQGQRAVGHNRQARDREVRPRGEAEETGLRCKWIQIYPAQLRGFSIK